MSINSQESAIQEYTLLLFLTTSISHSIKH